MSFCKVIDLIMYPFAVFTRYLRSCIHTNAKTHTHTRAKKI